MIHRLEFRRAAGRNLDLNLRVLAYQPLCQSNAALWPAFFWSLPSRSPLGHWAEFMAMGAEHGFVPRRDDALTFARKTRVLLARHQESAIDVDVVFGELPFEKEAVARVTWVELGGVRLPLPLPEDLIIMKAVAHRPQDLLDIEAILAAHPKIDVRRVRRWVREFSAALEMPEILNDLEVLLSQRHKIKR